MAQQSPPPVRSGEDIDRCDILDVLEEAVTTGRKVTVQLRDGRQFVDNVTDVETTDGQDIARFKSEGEIAVNDIRDCLRAEVAEPTYDAKLDGP